MNVSSQAHCSFKAKLRRTSSSYIFRLFSQQVQQRCESESCRGKFLKALLREKEKERERGNTEDFVQQKRGAWLRSFYTRLIYSRSSKDLFLLLSLGFLAVTAFPLCFVTHSSNSALFIIYRILIGQKMLISFYYYTGSNTFSLAEMCSAHAACEPKLKILDV